MFQTYVFKNSFKINNRCCSYYKQFRGIRRYVHACKWLRGADPSKPACYPLVPTRPHGLENNPFNNLSISTPGPRAPGNFWTPHPGQISSLGRVGGQFFCPGGQFFPGAQSPQGIYGSFVKHIVSKPKLFVLNALGGSTVKGADLIAGVHRDAHGIQERASWAPRWDPKEVPMGPHSL